MEKVFPKTIKELQNNTTRQLISALIQDEKNRCTNPNAPKYQELVKLQQYVSAKVPDSRAHSR